MSLGNALLGEALKIALPIAAEQITSYAMAKEPELKAWLEERVGHGNPLVQDLYQLLIEPELKTIGGILTLLGTPSPSARQNQPWPDYRDE